MAATPAPSQRELIAELDAELEKSVRLASNRAEHLRLMVMRSIVDRLRTAPPG
jgi:hypothetical protein